MFDFINVVLSAFAFLLQINIRTLKIELANKIITKV